MCSKGTNYGREQLGLQLIGRAVSHNFPPEVMSRHMPPSCATSSFQQKQMSFLCTCILANLFVDTGLRQCAACVFPLKTQERHCPGVMVILDDAVEMLLKPECSTVTAPATAIAIVSTIAMSMITAAVAVSTAMTTNTSTVTPTPARSVPLWPPLLPTLQLTLPLLLLSLLLQLPLLVSLPLLVAMSTKIQCMCSVTCVSVTGQQ
jgi:hypothetical protein